MRKIRLEIPDRRCNPLPQRHRERALFFARLGLFLSLALFPSGLLNAQTVPEAPKSLIAGSGDLFVVLSWEIAGNGGSPLTGYQYRQRVHSEPFGEWIDIARSGPTTSGYSVTHGVRNGTTYLFQVRSRNATRFSPPSNQARVTPQDRPPRLEEVWVPWYGTAIFASYSEPVLAVNGRLPSSNQFVVKINGVVVDAWAEFRRSSVKLNPGKIIYAGDSVLVSYASRPGGALEDPTGNLVPAFGPVRVWNLSKQVNPDTAP